jgi:hypothetical protein
VAAQAPAAPLPLAPPLAPAPAAATPSAVREDVVGIIARISAFPRDSIRDQQRLIDELGFDSLMVADLSGGRIVVTVEDEERPSAVEAFERVFAFRQRDYVERKRFSATANLFICAKAARAIGPFTNGLSEDVDWCRRGIALGFHLAFNDNSIVSHPARRDWSELIRKWDRIVAERWAGFGGRGLMRAAAWMGLAAATALSTAPHLLRVATSAELNSARDRAAAAFVLARIRLWRAMKMATLPFAK